jgi:hypothetical protein
MNPRWAVLVAVYLVLGLLGAWYLWGTTQLGADLATYQRAGDALWTSGDPYAANAGVPEDYRYRYPPLLAMVIPVLGWPPLWFALAGGIALSWVIATAVSVVAVNVWLARAVRRMSRQAGPPAEPITVRDIGGFVRSDYAGNVCWQAAVFGLPLVVLAAIGPDGAASFGVVAAVFEWGWGADLLNVAKVGPVIAFFPIILMGVLFGLAMDYEVFLVSRMREDYVHTGDARRSVDTGFTASARVVTAAAIIMIAVFAAFVPNGDPIVKPMALGLTVGVLVDAFLVRMTLVPAVLALLGRGAWWLPRWLDRRLPVLDVEGEALVHHLEHADHVAVHGEVAVRAREVEVPEALGPLSMELRPAGLGIVHGSDPVARSAALAAITGRLGFSGQLVVLDRLLPEEAGAVRARAALVDDVSAALELAGARRVPALVAIDSATSLDPGQLAALSALTSRGTTVLLGMPSLPAVPQVADAFAHAAPARVLPDPALTDAAASAADLETVR